MFITGHALIPPENAEDPGLQLIRRAAGHNSPSGIEGEEHHIARLTDHTSNEVTDGERGTVPHHSERRIRRLGRETRLGKRDGR